MNSSVAQLLLAIAVDVQRLVDAEFARNAQISPNSPLAQAGLRDGASIIQDYIDAGELGVAFDHVVYMIRELQLGLSLEQHAMLAQVARDPKLPESVLDRISREAG